MKKQLAVVLMLITFSACADVNTRDIPSPYKDKIAGYKADVVSLQHKCADLQKQMAELQAQVGWDTQQLDITTNEALSSLGYSNKQWTVNIDKMKIEPKQK
jgi:hypothetical protein